ncbi:MAG: transposase [Anaerolineae bacterium]|nr:transposase [Anaerolineae bacterium]
MGGPRDGPRDGPGEYWHSRGYLPHFESPDVIQHVTWHLADSMPKSALDRMTDELKHLPPDKQRAERRIRIEAWLDAGHGACILREPSLAQMTQACLLHFDGARYRMLAWVVMPNHVHTLFQPLNGWTVAKIVASWKKFTARQISSGNAPGIANLPIGALWHREYYDRFIRDERHFHTARNYIHQNPVKAGLCAREEDWVWSSAYAGGKDANREIGGPRGK